MKHKLFYIILLSSMLLAACGPDSQTQQIPTLTPYQEQLTIPATTPTRRPLPTVTPFPTATPADNVAVVETVEIELVPTNTRPAGDVLPTSVPETGTPTAVPPTSTPLPTSTPTEPAPEGVVKVRRIYYADYELGWPTLEDSLSRIYLENGRYVFSLTGNATRFVLAAEAGDSPVFVEVDVTPVQCPPTSGYGMYFDRQSATNFVKVTIFCNGRVLVEKTENGITAATPLLTARLPARLNPASQEPHNVSVLIDAAEITVFFDYEQVGTFTDSTFKAGNVAIYATNPSGTAMLVGFDNLEYWATR